MSFISRGLHFSIICLKELDYDICCLFCMIIVIVVTSASWICLLFLSYFERFFFIHSHSSYSKTSITGILGCLKFFSQFIHTFFIFSKFLLKFVILFLIVYNAVFSSLLIFSIAISNLLLVPSNIVLSQCVYFISRCLICIFKNLSWLPIFYHSST